MAAQNSLSVQVITTNRIRWLGAVSAIAFLVLAFWGCFGTADPRSLIDEPILTVERSDSEMFRGSVAFSLPQRESVAAGGETWTRVRITGLDETGEDGGPGIPTYSRLIAVPNGAEVVVELVVPVVAEVTELNLYPYQLREGDFSPAYNRPGEVPPEEEFWVPPFAKDPDAYGRDALYPESICRLTGAGKARGLQLAVLECAAGQYNPVRRELTLFTSVNIKIAFRGGSGEFLPVEAGNPFEVTPIHYAALAANAAAVDPVNHFSVGDWTYGEELLILTHPRYSAAAQELADHKREVGILTSVREVNDGGGPAPDTKEEILSYVQDRYHNAAVRPSYLLLLGDAQDIEPWILERGYGTCDPPSDCEFPSDFPYGEMDTEPSWNADLAVGRIPVNTINQADTVVEKIIRYESNPPHDPDAPGRHPFYSNVTIASAFQCCLKGAYEGTEEMGFIWISERLRRHLENQGYNVQRIYETYHRSDYPGDTTPRFYRNGIPLPPPLRPDQFAWDGDTQDIVDAVDEGSFLVFHNQHGWSNGRGWAHPRFVTSHLPMLGNGELLPVVVGANCVSGAYDRSQNLTERILRMSGGGAIGVFAYTRNSHLPTNRRMMNGIVASLWPEEFKVHWLHSFERARLGTLLNDARVFIAMGADSPKKKQAFIKMLHLFGDPTLKVWTQEPPEPVLEASAIGSAGAFEFSYSIDGAIITAVEPTDVGFAPIGRATVVDGVARMPFFVPPRNTRSVRFYVSAPGGISKRLNVNLVDGQ